MITCNVIATLITAKTKRFNHTAVTMVTEETVVTCTLHSNEIRVCGLYCSQSVIYRKLKPYVSGFEKRAHFTQNAKI